MSVYGVITSLLLNAKSNTSWFSSTMQVLGDYYAKAIFGWRIFDETNCWGDNSLEGNSPGGNLPGSNMLRAIFWKAIFQNLPAV